jgi:hypothetical protein
MPDKQQAVQRLLYQLALGVQIRTHANADADRCLARQHLRQWQSDRLARTHGEFLAIERYRAAAIFFLTDLYGPTDLSQRYAEAERVLPLMVRMLPGGALSVIADAIELDALCESLDADMVTALGSDHQSISDRTYGDAYRRIGRHADRVKQITLIKDLGETLDHLARLPMVKGTLHRMHLPARLLGLGELQSFLERGFDSFSVMNGADHFIATIVQRETILSRALFAGDDSLLGYPAEQWPAEATDPQEPRSAKTS